MILKMPFDSISCLLAVFLYYLTVYALKHQYLYWEVLREYMFSGPVNLYMENKQLWQVHASCDHHTRYRVIRSVFRPPTYWLIFLGTVQCRYVACFHVLVKKESIAIVTIGHSHVSCDFMQGHFTGLTYTGVFCIL